MSAAQPGTVTWRTSSYSANGGSCVEVGWHVSSHSANGSACVEVGWEVSSYSSNGAACVEVGRGEAATLVRDSKARGGPELSFPARSWHAFLGALTPLPGEQGRLS